MLVHEQVWTALAADYLASGGQAELYVALLCRYVQQLGQLC